MKAIRVLRLAIGENQAHKTNKPVVEILDTETGERLEGHSLLINGPSILCWSELGESPWAPQLAVHCWIETDSRFCFSRLTQFARALN